MLGVSAGNSRLGLPVPELTTLPLSLVNDLPLRFFWSEKGATCGIDLGLFFTQSMATSTQPKNDRQEV
jgi:hypothetical protein